MRDDYLRVIHGADAEWMGKWMVKEIAAMASFEVRVKPTIAKHTLPNMVFPTECYPRACQFIKSARIPDSLYVLGRVRWHRFRRHGPAVL